MMPFVRLALVAILAAGCDSAAGGGDRVPVAPVAPVAPPVADPPPEEVKLIPFRLEGLFFDPDEVLVLAPGARVRIEAVADGPLARDFTGNGQSPGVARLVRSDAPSTVLKMATRVHVGGTNQPGIIEIHALADSTAGHRRETWRVWIEEHPDQRWAEGFGAEIDETPLRLQVREAPHAPPPCEQLALTVRVAPEPLSGGSRAPLVFGEVATDYRRAEVTLRSDHPEASLELLSGYRMPYEDLDPESDAARVRYHPYPTTFALDLGFRELSDGFEQTLALGAFAGLQLRAEAPGCDPVEIRCDEDATCSTTAGP